jgi:hypothetical protein
MSAGTLRPMQPAERNTGRLRNLIVSGIIIPVLSLCRAMGLRELN